MNKCIFIIAIALSAANFCVGCKPSAPKTVRYDTVARRHFNILIVPDLSNRITLYPTPKNDIFIVQQFISMLYPDIINCKRQINQKDIFRLDFINRMNMSEYESSVTEINLKKFENNQMERNKYLGIFKPTSAFKQDTANFILKFKNLVKAVSHNTHGSDIYSYLNSFNDIEKDEEKYIADDENRTVFHDYYDNVIILLTDGYIETLVKSSLPGFTLTGKKVSEFRNEYRKHNGGLSPESFLEKNRKQYALTPMQNNALKCTRILALQLYDRGNTPGGNINPDLTDLAIIKLIWKDWLTKSGVKKENIELHSCDEIVNESSVKQIFQSFLDLK